MDFGELSAMKIAGYRDAAYTDKIGEYTVLINPETYSIKENGEEFRKNKIKTPSNIDWAIWHKVLEILNLHYHFVTEIHDKSFIRIYTITIFKIPDLKFEI